MNYIDCFLAPVPIANKAAYEELARLSAQVVKEYGALNVTECWLDEFGPESSTYHGAETQASNTVYASFASIIGARHDETVALSYIEWANKAARDAGMMKFINDPRMQFVDKPAAFDGKRLVAAGFKPMSLVAIDN